MLLLYICCGAPALPCRAPDNLIFTFLRAPDSLPRLTCQIQALRITDRQSDGLCGACVRYTAQIKAAVKRGGQRP